MRGQSVDLKRCFLASRKRVVDIRIGEVDFGVGLVGSSYWAFKPESRRCVKQVYGSFFAYET